MQFLAKWSPAAARVTLGLVFFVFGLNYFLDFLPPPPTPPEQALAFLGGLMAGGYVLPLVKTIEVVAGAALLANRFVPLALTVLAPIVVNIAAYHFLLAPGYAMPIALILLQLYLAWTHRAAFLPMLRARSEDVPVSERPTLRRTAVVNG
ncbi:MAG TPA: DoxX family protein [Polyangiaceae bacterium]